MTSARYDGGDRSFQYSTFSESSESSDETSEGDSGCFYRQTAKVRFTRTTSKVQHHMEARSGEGGRFFGCLRRTCSNSQLSKVLERSHCYKADDALSTSKAQKEQEQRHKELERTRQEVKRMDRLLKEQQKEVAYNNKHPKGSSAQPVSKSDASMYSRKLADGWIESLPFLDDSFDEDWIPPRSSSPSRSRCWEWCHKKDSSSWPPHIDLEPFNGDPMEWPKFIQRFKILIHDAMPNDTLRMIYLEELLSPALKRKYASLMSYPNCYRRLLVQLKNQFGNPVALVSACFEAFRRLAPIDLRCIRTSLTELSSSVDYIMNVLKTTGCEGELRTFSALELSGLVDKLDDELRAKWNSHVAENVAFLPDLQEFAIWLDETSKDDLWWS